LKDRKEFVFSASERKEFVERVLQLLERWHSLPSKNFGSPHGALTDIGLRVTTKHLTDEALSLKDVKEQIEFVTGFG
jgi:hypothetical protein